MASNDVTASGNVVYQDGDDITETNLAEALARGNLTDYVEYGLEVTLDAAADTIDIASGFAVIEDSNQAYHIYPDQETDLSLPNTSGNNYVFLVHDPATDDDVRYHIDDADTAPTDPSLKIAVVDTSADSVTELQRAPDVDIGSANIESLVIGGTLYEEDDNSPKNVSVTSSTTYTVSGSYKEILIVPQKDVIGFDQLQVNGDTGSNYAYVDNADTQTTGATEWAVPFATRVLFYQLMDQRSNSIGLGCPLARGSQTGQTVGGDNLNVSGDITQFTFSDSGSNSRDFKARVYGRVMSI